ncbi:DinB family protein [Virgibacillus kekensis]|uniref:DinB family protein n=1 Tax=Virgibacillus kekensis TaxID=202261 RepID=A0ABV9DJR1_9BACI
MEVNEKARKQLMEEIDGISDENLNKKSAENKWSIKQILEHLYLMEEGIANNIQGQLDNGEMINAEDHPIDQTINRQRKVEAPEFARPTEDFATVEEMKEKLATSHRNLQTLADTSDEKLLSERGFPHPFFNDMSLKQWIPFVGYHELRHVQQIREVKIQLGIA